MISFVYFDLGGVVIDDFSGNNKWAELKQELGVTPATDTAFEALWQRYLPEICLDRDVDTLVPLLESELGLRLPDGYSLLDGFVKRFYANPAIWPLLARLKSKLRIGLLTNMYPRMFVAIEQRHILPDVAWDVVIDSSVEQLQKPDPKLLAVAQQRAGVPNSQILFIDNSAEHITAAKAFGWQVFLYDSSDHVASVEKLGQLLAGSRHTA
ncbi:MAG TPA: HAD-IA family hydrolase [Candidatus Saccharimonadales bacterium]|nr:HAD-IA family hydrolase [Candidatus Saccharimonadales bacterium]